MKSLFSCYTFYIPYKTNQLQMFPSIWRWKVAMNWLSVVGFLPMFTIGSWNHLFHVKLFKIIWSLRLVCTVIVDSYVSYVLVWTVTITSYYCIPFQPFGRTNALRTNFYASTESRVHSTTNYIRYKTIIQKVISGHQFSGEIITTTHVR